MSSVVWKSLLLTSYLSYGFLSPMIVLIDVILSHLFVFLLHLLSISPFRCQLSCSRSSNAGVLKISKGVDTFDMYLASGLGTSPDKNPKDTKCETLVDTVLNIKKFLSLSYFRIPLPCTQTPFGYIRVTHSESSCTLCSYVACFNLI